MSSLEELRNKSWEELEIARHEDGRLMFKAELRRRNEKGKLETKPCRVCVPVPRDHVRARTEARGWFAGTKGLDADRDKDLFEEMESVCLLARAIRQPEAPYGQLMDHEELAGWDESSLKDIKERIAIFEVMLDPREPVTTEEQLWTVVAEVAKKGNLLPLADIVGHEQPICIVRMAREACLSPTAPSFARLLVNSTPEP